MYCDTNINVKQAGKKMQCKLFSELSIVRKYLTLMLFGSSSIVYTVSVKKSYARAKNDSEVSKWTTFIKNLLAP